ncbi:hypothetical protein GUI12_00825 [Anaplasmataceae bacterium AB001_6]|nr:hypothetical protein GUI12_00825 [Anaplasmataceae bacterium AB001_6]
MSNKDDNYSSKERIYIALAVEGRDPRGANVSVNLYIGEPKDDASPIAHQVRYYANKGISVAQDKIKLIETVFVACQGMDGNVKEEAFNYAFNGATKSISDTRMRSNVIGKGIDKGIAG